MLRHADLDRALRTLDPADPTATSQSPRARADLARIIASELAAEPVRPRPRIARVARRALISVAAVGSVTTVVLAAPWVTGGDAAFATWVPDGTTLTGSDRAAAIDECRGAMEDGAASADVARLQGADTAIAETRGVWTTVRMADDAGFSALCITDDSKRLFDDMIGSLGTPTGYVAPGTREILTTDLGTGSMDAGELSLAAGAVGDDVVGLSYRDHEGEAVVATVADGQFVLWLPGDDFEDAGTSGVQVRVTYTDGTSSDQRLTL